MQEGNWVLATKPKVLRTLGPVPSSMVVGAVVTNAERLFQEVARQNANLFRFECDEFKACELFCGNTDMEVLVVLSGDGTGSQNHNYKSLIHETCSGKLALGTSVDFKDFVLSLK